ncbi:hypothetical protein HPB47_024779 [Ixodes persulcatus]|uniref:Uncharacterized protein n=1 Tax=Ixodes persulcatus TaxID=34615 RepID=A0AC60Q635_IXOPE|nr:hypothetical protein HPB47_024779 [Ixodes persulcatus]
MVVHLKACSPCAPAFPSARPLGASKNRYARLVLEVWAMRGVQKNISSPSLVLTDKEIAFLETEMSAAGKYSALSKYISVSGNTQVGPGAALLAPARTLADIDGLGGGRRSEAGAALAGSPGDEPPRSNMELVRRSKNFSVAESDALISLWSDPETQKKFDSAYRHSVIWEMIANKLRMHGYDRSSIDCKTKINNLKATYFKFRRIYSAGVKVADGTTRSGLANALACALRVPAAKRETYRLLRGPLRDTQVEIHKAKTGAVLNDDLLAELRAYTLKKRQNRPPNDSEQEEPPSDPTPANVTCNRCHTGARPTVQHLARLARSRTPRTTPRTIGEEIEQSRL